MTDLTAAIEALRIFREAFVIAVDDKSPFAKQALAQYDKTRFYLDLAALERAGNQEGWQLVPKVLTEDMQEVAAHIADGPLVSYQEHWDAMLAAAPLPTPPPAEPKPRVEPAREEWTYDQSNAD